MPLLNGARQASVILGGPWFLGGDIGVIMTFTGTVSDFDRAGLFGLVIADDGALLPFNLREMPAALRARFLIGARVRFTRQAADPTARAVELAPLEASNDGGP
jgi:hypothetical protein